MEAVCQACKTESVVERVADDDPDEPYLLCQDCAERLRLRALRPLEWYNLAAKHGWRKYLLHFYQDDGTATLPDVDDFSSDGLRAPSLSEASQTLDGVLDYCMTRWRLGDAAFHALRSFPSQELLQALAERASHGNIHILAVTLECAAHGLGRSAEAWVRDQYERACQHGLLFSWAEAAAQCLPQGEGLKAVVEALAEYEGRDLQDAMSALSWFRSPLVLDWIEHHAPRTNVTHQWGQLAALSKLTWPRAASWLSQGRPYSLIALDALNTFIPASGHARIVQDLKPALLGNPDRSDIIQALQTQMLDDPAPRSVKKCTYLIENVDRLRIST